MSRQAERSKAIVREAVKFRARLSSDKDAAGDTLVACIVVGLGRNKIFKYRHLKVDISVLLNMRMATFLDDIWMNTAMRNSSIFMLLLSSAILSVEHSIKFR